MYKTKLYILHIIYIYWFVLWFKTKSINYKVASIEILLDIFLIVVWQFLVHRWQTTGLTHGSLFKNHSRWGLRYNMGCQRSNPDPQHAQKSYYYYIIYGPCLIFLLLSSLSFTKDLLRLKRSGESPQKFHFYSLAKFTFYQNK